MEFKIMLPYLVTDYLFVHVVNYVRSTLVDVSQFASRC